MASLEELRKKLFRKDSEFKEREQEPTLSPAPTAGPRSWGSGQESEMERILRKQQQKRLMRYALFATITFGVLVLAAAAAVFVFLSERASVTKENIFLVIEAPTAITVGEEVNFEVRFQNKNSIPLESVDLVFEFPESARPVFGEKPRGSFRERVPIGRLLPYEEQRETFTAFLFGNEGDRLVAKATLEYRPQNSSARYGKDITFEVSVERAPIGIAISIPEDATNGQEVEIVLDYVSTTESALKDVSLDIVYPPGFDFISSSPAPAKDNNLWYLGDVPIGGEGSIRIRGTVTGNTDEQKLFIVRVGVNDEATNTWSSYGQADASLVMRDTLLAVIVEAGETQKDGVVPGRDITFRVRWRNNLPVSARNVIVEATISGEAIEYAGVRSQKGSYDSARRRIVWTASQIPEFSFVSPGQSGFFSFSVPVLNTLPVSALQDKNFIISAEAVMFTNTVPEGFAGVETSGRGSASVKVITQMGFASRAFHRSGALQNTGPLPPRIGQKTTYTVSWSLSSSANDMEGVTVRASIPAYAEWSGVSVPDSEHITYDPDTREVIWDVGYMDAGTGYTRPARDVTFQIGIVPGVSHVGKTPEIISAALAAGRDTFTNFVIEEQSKVLTTRIRTDSAVTIHEYTVVE